MQPAGTKHDRPLPEDQSPGELASPETKALQSPSFPKKPVPLQTRSAGYQGSPPRHP